MMVHFIDGFEPRESFVVNDSEDMNTVVVQAKRGCDGRSIRSRPILCRSEISQTGHANVATCRCREASSGAGDVPNTMIHASTFAE